MQQPIGGGGVLRRALGRPLALGGSALDNARQAVTAVTQQLLDRAALAPEDPDAPLSPGDLAALTRDECLDLLRGKQLGRLAYVARAGVPDIAPVNYVVQGSDVLLRSGPAPSSRPPSGANSSRSRSTTSTSRRRPVGASSSSAGRSG